MIYLFIFDFVVQIIGKQSGIWDLRGLEILNDRQLFSTFWHSQCSPLWGSLNRDVRDSNSKRTGRAQLRSESPWSTSWHWILWREYKSCRAGSDILVVNSILIVHPWTEISRKGQERLREGERREREREKREERQKKKKRTRWKREKERGKTCFRERSCRKFRRRRH